MFHRRLARIMSSKKRSARGVALRGIRDRTTKIASITRSERPQGRNVLPTEVVSVNRFFMFREAVSFPMYFCRGVFVFAGRAQQKEKKLKKAKEPKCQIP